MKNKKKFKETKLFAFLEGAVSGENKVGQAIHGILDILPIPNQPIGKLLKAVLLGDKSVVVEKLHEVLTVRNVVAILLTVAYIGGIVTPEDVKNFVEVLNQVLQDLS